MAKLNIMASNFDFTEKTEQTLAASIQLAKDYAHAQGELLLRAVIILTLTLCWVVHPVHLASVLLNEGSGEQQGIPGAPNGSSSTKPSLFASVVQKAGGDLVRSHLFVYHNFALTRAAGHNESSSAKGYSPASNTESTTR